MKHFVIEETRSPHVYFFYIRESEVSEVSEGDHGNMRSSQKGNQRENLMYGCTSDGKTQQHIRLAHSTLGLFLPLRRLLVVEEDSVPN